MQNRKNPFHAKFFSKRLKVVSVLIYLALAVFMVQVSLITLVKGEENFEKSENNFLRKRDIEPPRGVIFDRNMKPVALNRHTYNIIVTRYKIPLNSLVKSVKEVSKILKKEIKVSINQIKAKPRWQGVAIIKGLSFDEALPIYERLHLLPGISVEDSYERYYPYGSVMSHVLGYVSLISVKQLEEYQEKGYTPYSYIGKMGIERQYESLLHGENGEDITVNDARGRKIEVIDSVQPKPGENLELTIDLDLQMMAVESLGALKGAVIAANPQTGEILALHSFPAFDPNNPSDKNNYFLNKAIRENYAPGSTFKPISAFAWLESGMSADEKVFCDSYFYIKGKKEPFRCDFRAGHGSLDLEEALKFSCNIYFYTIANKIGVGKIIDVAGRFGLGKKTGIDIPFERSGFLPTGGGDSLFRGEIVMLGIGQGKISVTPLQILNVYCALGNGGRLISPHVLKKHAVALDSSTADNAPAEFNAGEVVNINSNNLAAVRDGLYRVVHEVGGTGYRVGFKPEWDVAGKTGTAQNWRNKTPDAWFACWSPFYNPEIAVVAVIENAGHGAEYAAPITANIIAKYYEKKKAAEKKSQSN